MMALVMALQRCGIHSAILPGMLCGAVQKLHSCLAPLQEHGDLLNLNMSDVVMKDPVTLAPKESTSLPEGPVCVSTPSERTTSEPEEAAKPEHLALVPMKRPPAPPRFTLLQGDESGSPHSEQVDWSSSIPLGTQLDFASLESPQVAISHYPVTSKV